VLLNHWEGKTEQQVEKNKMRTGKTIYASLGFNELLTFDHTETQTPEEAEP